MANAKKPTIKVQDLISLVAIMAAAAITYFLALPQATTLRAKASQLQEKTAQVKQLNQQVADLEDLTTRLPQLQSELSRLSLAYPRDPQVVEAMIQAQAIAERAGVKINSISPAKPKGTSLPITLNVEGSYQALGNLLREFDSNLRPALVQSVSLVAGGEKAGGLMTMNITVSFEFSGAGSTASSGGTAKKASPSPAAKAGE